MRVALADQAHVACDGNDGQVPPGARVVRLHKLHPEIYQIPALSNWPYNGTVTPQTDVVFVSLGADESDPAAILRRYEEAGYNFRVGYVQRMDIFNKLQHAEVFKYAALFGLNDRQTREVHRHVREWSVIRMCCGFQANSLQRGILRGEIDPDAQEVKIVDEEHAGRTSVSSLGYDYTRCSTYNLQEIERQFLKGEVSRRYPNGLLGVAISPGYFQRFPKFEYKISHGYCARTTYALAHGYGFNGFKDEEVEKNKARQAAVEAASTATVAGADTPPVIGLMQPIL